LRSLALAGVEERTDFKFGAGVGGEGGLLVGLGGVGEVALAAECIAEAEVG
jgi:hypothetical protein